MCYLFVTTWNRGSQTRIHMGTTWDPVKCSPDSASGGGPVRLLLTQGAGFEYQGHGPCGCWLFLATGRRGFRSRKWEGWCSRQLITQVRPRHH